MVIEPYKYDISMLLPCCIYDIPHGIAYWRTCFPFRRRQKNQGMVLLCGAPNSNAFKTPIKNAANFLNKMITVDFLIANEDRHLNNLGLIRNAETLKWIGFAPIFDNGTSLVFHSKANPNIVCKPFKDTHSEQLRLVTSFDWLDLSKLNTLSDEAHNNYSYLYDAGYITLERLRQISSTVKERVDTLEEHIQKQSLSQNTYANFEEKTLSI